MLGHFIQLLLGFDEQERCVIKTQVLPRGHLTRKFLLGNFLIEIFKLPLVRMR